jgi:hypothetical protein
MAHLFEETGDTPRWRARPLAGDAFDLASDRTARLATLPELQRAGGPLLVRHWDDARNAEAWLLLAPPNKSVRVNGRRVANGISMLRHKDCVEFDAQRLFLSLERLARVEPFAAPAGKLVLCPRCRQPIEPHSPSVCCPLCHVAYHQTADLPCFRYAPKCALCPQPTDLGDTLTWTPEDI